MLGTIKFRRSGITFRIFKYSSLTIPSTEEFVEEEGDGGESFEFGSKHSLEDSEVEPSTANCNNVFYASRVFFPPFSHDADKCFPTDAVEAPVELFLENHQAD